MRQRVRKYSLADGLILMEDGESRRELGFTSRSAAKRAIHEFASLRNNLAHSQDIVTHDWGQIARMTHRVEQLARRDQ
jgi:hypothetical protein